MRIAQQKSIIISIFFIGLLVIGLLVFNDYGVHWDEYNNQIFGHIWRVYALDVIHNHSLAQTPLPPSHLMNWLHGPLIEILLGSVKNLFNLSDVRDILLFRHLCCFLIFTLGVYFFYLLCEKHFKNWKIALLGCLFLTVSPRIFAHSFYDTFDIPFLSFFVISIYTLIQWLEQRTFLHLLFHTLACAILIDIRLIGLLLVLFTFLLGGRNFLKETIPNKKCLGFHLCIYIGLGWCLIILGWPLLWQHPLLNFKRVLFETLHADFPYSVFYLGKFYLGNQLPWHYGPLYLLITTPLFYDFCFLIGTFAILKSLPQKNHLLFFLCLMLPFCLTFGKLYNGWRHLLFIYPIFIIFGLTGWLTVWNSLKQLQKPFQEFLILLTVLSISHTIYTMIKLHPFEYVYFNRLAGSSMQQVKDKFELDYWGLTYRQGLEYILNTDPSPLITVSGGLNDWPLIRNNINILPSEQRKRLKESPLAEAKYFLTNYLQHPYEYPLPEYASIKVDNVKILGIYRLK